MHLDNQRGESVEGEEVEKKMQLTVLSMRLNLKN